MSLYAIACYRPKDGQADALLRIVREHHPALLAEGLVTAMAPCVMHASNGSLIEVFEWESTQSKNSAHENAAVRAIWNRMSACADFPPLSALDETQRPFASFQRLEL